MILKSLSVNGDSPKSFREFERFFSVRRISDLKSVSFFLMDVSLFQHLTCSSGTCRDVSFFYTMQKPKMFILH